MRRRIRAVLFPFVVKVSLSLNVCKIVAKSLVNSVLVFNACVHCYKTFLK